MALMLRDVREQDLDTILELNNNAGPSILPVDANRIRYFFEVAPYFRVAEINGQLAGFLIALDESIDYDSPHFAWFKQRQAHYSYIDRIVIDKALRGTGLGRVFYADMHSFVETRSPILCCEVFLEPRDDVSVLFHGMYGFNEIGQATIANTSMRVGYLAKSMCSYPFIQAEYLNKNGLPDLPWLRTRPVNVNQTAIRAVVGK